MRSMWFLLATALCLALVAQPVRADDVEDQLAEMQKRMLQMEERLQATQDQLEATEHKADQQQELIEQAGLASGDQAASGLSAFLDTLEVGGWVAGSYLWNANKPDFRTDANIGVDSLSSPLHPDHNSFSLDQLWFVLSKPATVESRGGFHAEIAFGKTAGLLNAGNTMNTGAAGPTGRDDGFGDNDVYVMGYAEYLTPWGPKFKAGKFWTPVGAEVAQSPYNLNITRGLVWNLFQPVDHIGAMVEQTFDNGVSYGLGIVNGFSSDDPDINDSKTGLAHLGWSGEQFSLGVNGLYGNEFAGNESDQTYLIDAIATWNPTEKFTAWINGDYLSTQLPGLGGNYKAWGGAVAARYAITERLGIAARGEVVNDHDGIIFGRNIPGGGVGCNGCAFTRQRGSDAYSVTGTVDYSLTEHLLVRAEVRWDTVDIDGLRDDEFAGPRSTDFNDPAFDAASFDRDDQILTAVEVIYNF